VSIRVPREWAKEPAIRPRRQIGPVNWWLSSRYWVELERWEWRWLTANPDHEVAVSRVALDERNDDGCGEIGNAGSYRAYDGDVRWAFELGQSWVVRLEDAEA
jgi:hypothetical protein